MAQTKDIFAPLMAAAKKFGLPTGMLQEVFDANDTTVTQNGSPEYWNGTLTSGGAFGDNLIALQAEYLTGDSSALLDLRSVQKAIESHDNDVMQYAPVPDFVKQPCGPRKGAYRWVRNPDLTPENTVWVKQPCGPSKGAYRWVPAPQPFMPICVNPGALYNEMFHAWYDQVLEESDSRIYDYLIDQAKSRYSNNLLAIQECWSDTADKYITAAYDNYRKQFQYEWVYRAGYLVRTVNSDFGKPPTPLTYEFTKFRVSHEEKFDTALANVVISQEEWTFLVKVLEKGMKAEKDFPVSQRRDKEKREKEERYAVRRK